MTRRVRLLVGALITMAMAGLIVWLAGAANAGIFLNGLD